MVERLYMRKLPFFWALSQSRVRMMQPRNRLRGIVRSSKPTSQGIKAIISSELLRLGRNRHFGTIAMQICQKNQPNWLCYKDYLLTKSMNADDDPSVWEKIYHKSIHVSFYLVVRCSKI